MTLLSSVFIGRGHVLVQCAELWLERGHRIVCVISDCKEVTAWARHRHVARVDSSEEERAFLAREPFEYLFSIVNHRVTSREVLRRPTRAAINYHDSLLPAYAGFNATAWAIFDGNRTHGITWHRMREDVDAGEILKQVPIDIAEDDTAFTLEAKCFAAAVSSFADLVDEIAQGRLEGRSQSGARSFHFMSDRPDAACLLDWQDSTDKLWRGLRALTFGPGDHVMGLAKIWDGRQPIWITNGSLGSDCEVAPGTVVGIEDGALEIAVGGREVLFSGLMDVTGKPLSASDLRARGLEIGVTLQPPDPTLLARITELDRSLRKAERFWVRRLAARSAPRVPSLGRRVAAPNCKEHPVRLSSDAAAALDGTAPDERLCFWAAAFALILARISETDTFDLDFDAGRVKGALSDFFAVRVPLHVRVDPQASFESLRETVRIELSELGQRHGHARDIIVRYAELRRRHTAGELDALPAALVRRSGDVSLDGATLLLSVSEDGLAARFYYDDSAFDAGDATAFFERFEILSRAAWTDPHRAVGRLPVLLPRERQLLLEEWNVTQVRYREDRCVHELFEEQVARTKDKVALVFGDRELTYAELNRRANVVARRLAAAGVGPETLVGICIERSLDLAVGLLGILKAGGAYVPLDPVYPRERLALMLTDAAAPVLLTQRHLATKLPAHGAEVVCIDELWGEGSRETAENPQSGVTPDNLAYVIFTSGSTGRPKGVMVLHRNVSNFFTGMDQVIGTTPGVWLAVTSICFDISVLELFWTLARGFEVVIQEESDRASLGQHEATRSSHPAPMGFGLFYFAADAADPRRAYRLLLEGAKFADANGFEAVWTPERHFHAFGGLYPNPAVTSAALAAITTRVKIRAGSVVLPLHDPIRVAEEWSVVDNLSNGRVGLSFASGWHANDFVFKPENFESRRDVMRDSIATVLKLWRGETIRVMNGEGKPIDIATLPRPVQAEPPLWIASAGNVDTFRAAGAMGVNVLTNMLGQTLGDLRDKLAAYRAARREAGHAGDGIVSVMLHTFIGPDTEEVRRLVKGPFCSYLATSFDLVKMAPWAFPAFRRPSQSSSPEEPELDTNFTPEDMQALMDHAFDRYFDTAGLFGTPEKALGLIDDLKRIGVNEVACLVDFGVDVDVVLQHLVHLKRLLDLSQPAILSALPGSDAHYTIAQQFERRKVTHLQCTPSMARMLATDPEALASMRSLQQLLLGGEALPTDLADQLTSAGRGHVLNMYGPTETTVWSTTARVEQGRAVTIGRPIANTIVRLLDSRGELVPIGTAGELCIGGAGVARGYLQRPDLTEARFIDDPHAAGGRLYRTGDLARYRRDGTLEFLGRLDQQVKVNGYRIELGEIETVLERHAAVHQAVVVAREDASAGTRLVAYVVPSAVGPDASSEQSVAHWQALWDETYAQSRRDDETVVAPANDPRFDIVGWKSSYTGEPIESSAMSEWLEHTVRRILELQPKRVLEIGCGTGLLLYRLLPHVEHYTGVDFAEHALEQIRQELRVDEQRKVTLVMGTADTLAVNPGYDVVILNSVVQYFPSAEYLMDVVERAEKVVVDGGHIWLGDIRSLPLLETFHTAVELHQALDDTDATALRGRIAERVEREAELVLDPLFFRALLARIPRLRGARIQLKRGHHRNELTQFRYDVVLRVGSALPSTTLLEPTPAPSDLDEVRAMLRGEPDALWLMDLPNARLSAELAAVRNLGAGVGAAATFRAGLGARTGIDPEAVCELHPDYEVELRFPRSGALDRFDAVLRHRDKSPPGVVSDPTPSPKALQPYANRPARSKSNEGNVSQWRAHLREHLPEYMIPAAFVVLSELPLTPNGKIDRKALPAPDAAAQRPTAEYVPPVNDIERTIAEVWERMLGLTRVGLTDNIFDLGANSLLTVQANSSLAKLLGRKISLVSMFQFPTVGSLAAHLTEPDASPQAEQSGRERADRRKDALEHRRQARTRLTKG